MTYCNTLLSVSLITLAPFAATAGNLIEPVIAPAPAPQPPVLSVQDNTTSWGGAYGGLAYGQTSGNYDDGIFVPGVDLNEGSATGVFAGYLWQRGALVYGAELSYFSTINTNVPNVPSFLGGSGGDDEFDSLLDLRAIIGYAVGDFMFYGAAGVTRTEFTYVPVADADFNGINLGLGVNYMVTDQIFLGVDYTTRTLDYDYLPGVTFDAEVNTLTARVAYHF
jgi:outer membrane immunogenic protein